MMTDAERKKLVISALIYAADLHKAKKSIPSTYTYNPRGPFEKKTVRYSDFVYPWAKRLLPHQFADLMVQGIDEGGKPTGELDLNEFYDEIWRNKNEEILTSLTKEDTAPRESEKINQKFDQELAHEQEATKTEASKPEPQKKEIKEPEGPSEVEEEKKTEPEKKPEVKKGEAAQPSPQTTGAKSAKVEEMAWVEAAKPFPAPAPKSKLEAATPKPKFTVVGGRKINLEKPKQSVKRLQPKQRAQVLKAAVTQPKVSPSPREDLAKVPVPVPPLPQRLKLVKNTPIPEPVKDASSLLQRAVRKLIYKIKPLPLISGTVLGVVGFATFGPAGAVAGAGLGVAGSNLLQNRAKEQQPEQEAEVEAPMLVEEIQPIEEGPESESQVVGPTNFYPEEEPSSYQEPDAYYGAEPTMSSGGGAGGGSSFNPLRSITNSYRPSAGNIAKSVGKQIGKQALKQGARQAGAELATAAAANPEVTVPVLAGIGVVIVLIAVLLVVLKPNGGGLLESTSYCAPYPPNNGRCAAVGAATTPIQNQIKVTKTADKLDVPNGTDIPFTITVANTTSSQATNIQIQDKLPSNTSFVSASDGGTNNAGVVTWTIPTLAANQSTTLSLVLHPTQNDTYVTNAAGVVGGTVGGVVTNPGGGTTGGNPGGGGGGGTQPPGTGNTDLTQAAADIVAAYGQCGGGFTYASVSVECMKGYLLSQSHGYSQANVDAFAARMQSSLVTQNGITCTQCLGFVAEALSLVSGDSSTLGYPTAFSLSNLNSFTAGGVTYKNLGAITDVQPGDIAVATPFTSTTETIPDAGHVSIVNQVTSPGVLFTAFESNFGLPGPTCQVTTSQRHPIDGYIFFRRQ